MRHSKGPGGRAVDLTILRELDHFGPVAASAAELADRLMSSPGSIASTLRSLVKAELVQVNWGTALGGTRTYAITDAGRQYLVSVSAA
jgi:DNA-binding PadR family transcriptional regulator